MIVSCTALYERISEYLPCQNWLWPVNLEDLEEPILQPPVQSLSECWVPPKTLPFESSLHDSKTQEWQPRHLRTTGSSNGSWDIDAAHADGVSTPTSQSAAVSSRQQSGTTANAHDIHDASEGIELRPAKANALLGQYHMEKSGQFVSAKPGRVLGPRPDRLMNSMRTSFRLEERGQPSRIPV